MSPSPTGTENGKIGPGRRWNKPSRPKNGKNRPRRRKNDRARPETGKNGPRRGTKCSRRSTGWTVRSKKGSDSDINEDPRANIVGPGIRKTAAAYSPTWWGSTIGDGGLNFSVRNGKRWYPAAIATAIYYLREIINAALLSAINASFVFTHTLSALQLHSRLQFPAQERFRAISTGRLRTLLPVHLLPINVVVSHDPIRKSHLGDGFALRCFQRLS